MKRLNKKTGIAIFTAVMAILAVIILVYHNPLANPQDELLKKVIACVLIVAAVILVCALGFNSVGGVSFAIAGVNINLSGLAIAAIAGILLNAILPGNDYEFDAADGSEAASSSNLQV